MYRLFCWNLYETGVHMILSRTRLSVASIRVYLYLSVELEIENSEEHEGDKCHACVDLSALDHLERHSDVRLDQLS